ncbi:MAG: MutS2/Smr-associated SH3 domain-containing protein, partial [Pseudomonadota bacterium]
MQVQIPEKTALDLGWPQLLEHWAAKCHTEAGARAVRVLPFLDEPAQAEERIAQTSEARQLYEMGEPPPFAGIRGVGTAVARADKGGALTGEELVEVGETIAGCARLRRHLVGQQAQVPRLAAVASSILELSHVSAPILDSFDDGRHLLDSASPALGPLRRKLDKLHAELGRRAQSLVDDPDVTPYLQDRFYTSREDRYVLPVKSSLRARVRGIVHGTSQSGQTVFIEPEEIIELNNRLKLAESEVAEEERRILAELSSLVREAAPAIGVAVGTATVLDVVCAAARLAEAMAALPPAIDRSGRLALRGARHPLMVLGGSACVPIDLELAPRTVLVVSGPNAGGKTVSLKTTGLLALMVRVGLHLPTATRAEVPWYSGIWTDIGDEQSLERNLSTFSAHLLRLRDFVARADQTTLLLIDELAVGTDPEQGASLAQAVLEELAIRAAHTLVTTHYERLKCLAPTDGRFVNASVGFDLERMVPTFRLHLGLPGSSGAIDLARRLAMPGTIVTRAEILLGERQATVDALLRAVADERHRLELEQESAARAARMADAAKHQAESARQAAEAKLYDLRHGYHDEAMAALRQARDELDGLRKEIRRGGRDANLDEAKQEIARIAGVVAGHAPKPRAPDTERAPPEMLVVGANVLVASLGARGRIVDLPRNGRVAVQIGRLHTSVPVEDV